MFARPLRAARMTKPRGRPSPGIGATKQVASSLLATAIRQAQTAAASISASIFDAGAVSANPTFTSLGSGLGVNGAPSVTTTSVTLTANRLCLLTIVNAFSGGTPNTPTCSGWTLVTTVVEGNIARMTVLRRMVTSDLTQSHVYDFAGQNQNFTKWAISQSSADVDTSGTNGSGAIVQSATNSFLELTPNPTPQYASVTLSAFASAANSTFSVFGGSYATYTPTAGDGFASLATPGVGSAAYALITEYKAANDTVADVTWSGEADVWVGAALEIRASYNLAAVIAAIRTDPVYGSVWSDTSDPTAPNGLELPTPPQGTLTVFNVSSIASLNAAIGSGRHIIMAPGSYTSSGGGPVLDLNNVQDVRVTLTGCTFTCNKVIAYGAIATGYRARRIEIIGGAFDAGYHIEGKHIKIYGSTFNVSTAEGPNPNVALIGGDWICWERTTHRMANGGPLWCERTVHAVVMGTYTGGVFNCTSITGGDPIETGMAVEWQGGGSNPGSNGTWITGQLSGTPGGVGTYSISRSDVSTTATSTIFISGRTTNAILANSDVLETIAGSVQENLTRVLGGQFILAVDSRLASTPNGTNGRPTFRFMSNGATGFGCKNLMTLRCQLETSGVWMSPGGANYPMAEKLYVVDTRIYIPPSLVQEGTQGINVSYDAKWSEQVANNGAAMSSNGTTTSVTTESTSGPHLLATGTVLSITGYNDDVFLSASNVTITSTGSRTFTFPKVGTPGSATGTFEITTSQYRGTTFFYMKNSEMFTAPRTGVNGNGWTPPGAQVVGPTWTTVYPGAATAAANGNYYRTYVTPPTWSFR